MVHADYVRVLKPLLPKQAFFANPKKLRVAGIHILIIGVSWGLFRVVSPVCWPVLALVVGHSLACLGFFAHELSHGTVVRATWWRYSLELIAWGLNIICPTLWRKIHNVSHHGQANAINDPDRRFMASEDTSMTRWYSFLFFPHKHASKNLFPFLHFLTYILRHSVAVFYREGRKPGLTTFRPSYTRREQSTILGEIFFLVAVQIGIYAYVGDAVAWLWASPVSLIVASCILQVYLFTNHFLNPLGDGGDPVLATTSVRVPALMNSLHFNFSYHTEHHLFPGMDSEYYPLLSDLIRQRYGDRYHNLPLAEAWSHLLEMDLYVAAPEEPSLVQYVAASRHNVVMGKS